MGSLPTGAHRLKMTSSMAAVLFAALAMWIRPGVGASQDPAIPAGFSVHNVEVVGYSDIGDPAHPVEAGRWWVPGQKENAGEPALDPGTPTPGMRVPRTSFHGPASVAGTTAATSLSARGETETLRAFERTAVRAVGQVQMELRCL